MYKTQSLDGHNKYLLCWSPLTYIYQFVDKFIFHFLTIYNVLVSLQAVLNVLILAVLQLLPETQCLVKTTLITFLFMAIILSQNKSRKNMGLNNMVTPFIAEYMVPLSTVDDSEN